MSHESFGLVKESADQKVFLVMGTSVVITVLKASQEWAFKGAPAASVGIK